MNSFWARGYGDPPPEILIVLGASREDLEPRFESCELVGHITNREGIANEETTDHPDIFLCRRLRGSWKEVGRRSAASAEPFGFQSLNSDPQFRTPSQNLPFLFSHLKSLPAFLPS